MSERTSELELSANTWANDVDVDAEVQPHNSESLVIETQVATGQGCQEHLHLDSPNENVSDLVNPPIQALPEHTAAIDASAANARIAYLDGFRALAALFVLVHHSYAMAYPMTLGAFPEKYQSWLRWAVYGNLGVSLFIVLAGYSLGLGVARKHGELPGGFWGYMKRRARRIIPPYWATIVITTVLLLTVIGEKTHTHWDNSVPLSWRGFVVNMLLLQDLISPVRNVAYTLWSVSVEFHIYLLLPLMLFIRRKSNWWAAVGVGTLLGIAGMVLQTQSTWVRGLYPDYYVLFVMGFASCLLVKNPTRIVNAIPWGALSLISIAVFILLCNRFPDAWVGRRHQWAGLLLGVAACTLFLAMGTQRAKIVTSILSSRTLVMVGGFSYSLYLIHAQVLQLFWKYVVIPKNMPSEEQLLWGWLLACPISIICAWLFSLVFEKPFLNQKRDRMQQ